MTKIAEDPKSKTPLASLILFIVLCAFSSAQAQVVGTDPPWGLVKSDSFDIAVFDGGESTGQRIALIYPDGNSERFDRITEELSKSLGPSSSYSPTDFSEGAIPTTILVRPGVTTLTEQNTEVGYCMDPTLSARQMDFCERCREFPFPEECTVALQQFSSEQIPQIRPRIRPSEPISRFPFVFEGFRPTPDARLSDDGEANFQDIVSIAINPDVLSEIHLDTLTVAVNTNDPDTAFQVIELLLTPAIQEVITNGTRYEPALIDEQLQNVP